LREREKILGNLESLYREGFRRAEEGGDQDVMARMDFDFQRDQLHLEILLDIRELLATMETPKDAEGATTSLLEKAQAIRRLTKLR
jgi:hypothetical protein